MFEVLIVVCAFSLSECRTITAPETFATREECHLAVPRVYGSFMHGGHWPAGTKVSVEVIGCGRDLRLQQADPGQAT